MLLVRGGCGRMAGSGDGFVNGVGLVEAIDLFRSELLTARAAGAESEIQLPVEAMTVQLQVVATRTGCRCPEWTAWMSEVLCTPGDLLLAHHISTVR